MQWCIEISGLIGTQQYGYDKDLFEGGGRELSAGYREAGIDIKKQHNKHYVAGTALFLCLLNKIRTT